MNTIVTGAASGIGCRLVTLLAEAGHSVIAADIAVDRLRQAAADCHWPADAVVTRQLDVRSAAGWSELMAEAVARFGRLDCLFNVAGVVRIEAVHQAAPESIALHIDVNAKGVMLGTCAAAAIMVGQGSGQIVNMGSLAALAPVPGLTLYTASKFAVRGFSLAADLELEPRGVRVSVVCPDAVDTPMVDYQLDHPAAALTFSGSRILSVDEVARATLSLLGKPRPQLVVPWSRGLLARSSTLLPRFVHRWISAQLTARGLRRQQKMRDARL